MPSRFRNTLIRFLGKLLYLTGFNRLLARGVNRPVVLCFHQVKAEQRTMLDRRVGTVTPHDFAKTLAYMVGLGYEFVNLAHLVEAAGTREKANCAAVTFDDGYQGVYSDAYPLLRKRNIPFTVFLTTSTLEADHLLWLHAIYASIEEAPAERRAALRARLEALAGMPVSDQTLNAQDDDLFSAVFAHCRYENVEAMAASVAEAAGMPISRQKTIAARTYLRKEHLAEMTQHGLSIEAHGHLHAPPARMSPDESAADIEASIRTIREEFGKETAFYAPPFGREDLSPPFLRERFGINAVFGVKNGVVPKGDGGRLLPRISVFGSFEHFVVKLAYAYVVFLAERARDAVKKAAAS